MQQFMRSNALSPMVMVCTDRSSRGMDFDRAEASVVRDEKTLGSSIGSRYLVYTWYGIGNGVPTAFPPVNRV